MPHDSLRALPRSWWAGSGRRIWLPNALAYAPQLGTHLTHPMTFLQRLHNSAIYLGNCAVDHFRLQPILKRFWRARPPHPAAESATRFSRPSCQCSAGNMRWAPCRIACAASTKLAAWPLRRTRFGDSVGCHNWTNAAQILLLPNC